MKTQLRLHETRGGVPHTSDVSFLHYARLRFTLAARAPLASALATARISSRWTYHKLTVLYGKIMVEETLVAGSDAKFGGRNGCNTPRLLCRG